MRIVLCSGVGRGPTPIAAFAAALFETGAAHYNFIHLSSAIPIGAVIERGRYRAPAHEFGWRKFAVISERRVTTPGEQAWAGLGWVQDAEGKGIFVEIQGSSEAAAKADIISSLETMIVHSGLSVGPIRHELVGIRCEDQPVCALVLAVFEGRGDWPAP